MRHNNRDAAAAGRTSIALAAAIVVGLAVPGAGLGQQQENVVVDVGECVKLQSPGERLDCYEEQVARARAEQPPAPAAPPAPAPVAPPAPAPVAPPAPAPAAQAAAPVAAPTQAPSAPPPGAAAPTRPAPVVAPSEPVVRSEEIRAPRGATEAGVIRGSISALRQTVPNAYLITLDNGQVWRQDYPERYQLRVGQQVEIAERGGLAGYRLTGVGTRGSIQVERVR